MWEKEKGGKKTHGFAISLDSIKFPNNFVLTKSNNLFKSNKTTKFNKKTHFKPTCLCIIRYVRFTDTIQFIQYALMYWTIHKHLRYFLTIRNFFVHDTIRIAHCTILTTMLLSTNGQPNWPNSNNDFWSTAIFSFIRTSTVVELQI